ncbi:MAG: protein translocase subunit SecD [Nitriliruptoraceae bacterium]|nr:protein translocase subunit SecD [Nitriliruptoraceae bacterium]
MDKKPLAVTLSLTLLVALAAGVYLGLGARPNLGLDLQGGISGIYIPQLPEGEEEPDDFEEIIDETIEVIRARIDSLGVAEPNISRSGTDVEVQLPGATDADRLRELIGRTAQLTFHRVVDVIDPSDPDYEELGPDCTAPVDEREPFDPDEGGVICGTADQEVDPQAEAPPVAKYEVQPAEITGDRIDDAFPSIGQGTQNFEVGLRFDSTGGQQFANITADLACERDAGRIALFAIVLDDVVESAPTVNPTVLCGQGITGNQATITVGQGLTPQEQEQEARDLALVLRTGALPITLEEATFETVSATLGQDSLQAGLLAGLIGLLGVAIYLTWFYRWLGLVAMAGLAIFGVWTVAIISLLGEVGFALTLAGVAGLIVAIGITADSSIIYFERVRDEVNLGKTVRTAAQRAFGSAFQTNLAGNTVTLAAAAILYFLAVGPVRGFALMLGLATLLDLIILWAFTRPMVGLMSTTKLMTRKSVRAVDTAPARRVRTKVAR